MEMKVILDRIEGRLKDMGMSAASASREATGSPDTIRNWHRALRDGKDAGATLTKLSQLAQVLNINLTELLGGESPAPAPNLRRVVVGAFVQAGLWAEAWEWPDSDQYDVYVSDEPELRSFRLYAAETRGPSMNRRWPEKTVVVFTNVQETLEEPIPGKRYVVERRRLGGEAEHTVKLLHQDADGRFWLMPESDDPRYQAPISVEDGLDGETITVVGRVHFAVTRE